MGGAAHVSRGAILNSVECRGVVCRFRTVFDVALLPLAVTGATFHATINMPLGMQAPAGVTSSIRIELASLAPSRSLAELAEQGQAQRVAPLRLYLDGDPALCAALRDTLFLRVAHAYVEASHDERWRPLESVPLREVGFEPEDAMAPQRANMHPSWRLLTEYFACAEKFNFVDVDLAAIVEQLPPDCRHASLHLALTGIGHDAGIAQLLRPLSAAHFQTGCTPVINLFPQAAVPIKVDHTAPDYALLASAENAHAYDIHSIEAVRMLRQSERNEELVDFHPYYSLRHGDAGGKRGRYWTLRRDEVMSHTQPGYEYRIAFVDLGMQPLALETATVSVTLNCSNRDMPHEIPWGAADGDLCLNNATDTYPIRLLRKPTLSCRFPVKGHWRLISQLSLNLRALLNGGLPVLKEMLLLHDMRLSPVTQRMIDGIQDWTHKRGRHWLADGMGGSYVYGVDIHLALDSHAFAGVSMHAFIRVLDCFLGHYAPLNSFTRLEAYDHATGKELMRCQPRCGDTVLA
jgi:type VI secretion system protein ImpG